MGCDIGELLQGFDCGGGEPEFVADGEVYCVDAGVRWVCDAIAVEAAEVLEEAVVFRYEGDGFIDVVWWGGGAFGTGWEEDAPADEGLDEQRDCGEGPEGLWGSEGSRDSCMPC